MFLDEDQLQRLTARTYNKARSKVLSQMGIDHKLRPDGSIVVLTSVVEAYFSGGVSSSKKKAVPAWEQMP